MSEHEISDPFRHCLKVSVSALCTEVGFESAEASTLETLTELTASLLTEVGRSARAFCELAGRVEPLVADVVLALVELGIPLEGMQEFAMRGGRVALPAPAQAVPAKQTAILHTGNKKRHPNHIPEYLPEMPDSHSYIRTPTHRQPITDYESVREKAASQKRDVERALTRFIAKTGKIHNLFNTEDSNLFPLISCEKDGEGFRLPAYVDALLFKDQLFEEEEIERRPKRRKHSQRDFDEEEEGGGSGGGSGGAGASADDSRSRLNQSMAESDIIDNPFLKPVRMPRTPKK